MPFSRKFDPQGEVFSAYQKAGVSCVVMLVSDEEVIQHSGYDLRRLYEDAGMQVIACPVEDFSTPPRGAFDEALKLVIENAGRGWMAARQRPGSGRSSRRQLKHPNSSAL